VLRRSESWNLNDRHIHGNHIPVNERSKKGPLDSTNDSHTFLAPMCWTAQCVCYVVTARACLSGERYHSTAATKRSAGTSPTK
jgi:hypothetical protein